VQGLVDGSSHCFGQIDQAAVGPVHDDDEHDHDMMSRGADTDDENEEEIEAARQRASSGDRIADRDWILDPSSPHGQVTTAPRVEARRAPSGQQA